MIAVSNHNIITERNNAYVSEKRERVKEKGRMKEAAS